MNILRSLLKSINSSFWLGLLTFLLIITVLPATARQSDRTQQPNLDSSNMLLEGVKYYETGKFREAAELWQQTKQLSQQQNDRLTEVASLNYLSLAEQKLGQWQQASKAIDASLEILQDKGDRQENYLVLQAQALNTKGSLQLAIGQTEAALKSWQEAERSYASAGDETGVLGARINQTQALQSLGLYRRSQLILEQIQQKLENQPDSPLKATGLRSLGVTLQVVGDLNKSERVLKQSLAIAQKLNLPEETSATLLSLGNTARSSEKIEDAISLYQQAATTSNDNLSKLQAQLNQLRLLVSKGKWQETNSLMPEIESNLTNLSNSREAVYAKVNLAESLMQMDSERGKGNRETQHFNSLNILQESLEQAKQLQDPRAESYVLGTLGKFYERQQQWQQAKQLSEEALKISQEINAFDIAYQWQWQLGRILTAQKNISGAIAAESEAVKTLQSLRKDLVAVNPDVQFSFRDSVEPVYRDLVGLLLTSNPDVNKLRQARETIESLQVAELENFFREACLDTKTKAKQIDEVDPTAAVVYPIVLRDRIAAIFSIPGQPLSYYQTDITQPEVENTLEQLLQSLNPVYSDRERLRLSQQVYSWLIEPAEADLSKNNIKTLVFVLDSGLRNLPMAALYDGKQYLVEKYNVALTPGMQLLEPKSLAVGNLNAVIAGISESSQGFVALPGVKTEVQQISSEMPSTLLLNQNFTNNNLQNQLQETSAPVIHLATHGQFSSDPEETYILTWDRQIKVKDFETLLRSREQRPTSPIELMVLSACQTASGDNRAALGMAGMAIRSGARSTLATLWSVQDQSTSVLMTEFYQKLNQKNTNLTKAEALRQAQLALVNSKEYHHPFYWAPFVLVGNWL
jgi:CHAT domain-containing protein/tetratricopeptide (TPR) repeat protein